MPREPEPDPFESPAGSPGDLVDRLRRIHRDNERLFERLVDGEQRFRALARAVWEVQEEERRRVARELHDGLGQTLTALKIRVERLGARVPDELAADLRGTAELAGQALAEARRLAHLLRPQVLDDLGLYAALRWLARTLGEWTGFAVALEHPPLDVERGGRLDPEIETLAFRVVQEGLTNAMKHSGAAGAGVAVERRAPSSGPVLALRVTDRGRGLDPEEVLRGGEGATGFGLRGMQDRVELAGGRFELRSPPGGGTILEVELPIGERRREDA
ncbi:MAG TPA: sensor histidine kinase [Thermoanaerobaculia bacterium]